MYSCYWNKKYIEHQSLVFSILVDTKLPRYMSIYGMLF